ncbi:MAG TPA: cation transporter [Fermentimonas caenicola]|jgi:cobalt-zinc-cadmium efflux system protein|uniref:cation diffusion facilitator family transporter n=1 Tax=Lascolabacillus TaxID=1924067 RepID=UPI0006B370DF|nr:MULTISPECIES: cation diffusion facilitator family transporter [Lascolabacillus]MBP6174663.1 cation transporter [Fermentimonas sp.]MDI9625006.1 cation diffusion facilitator family transporter [Bacteroidota bacterium]TAH61596.1 MAG: cation transporter [Fermentimonas caenicola]MBP6195935.1 cation transporter [Fermentimonas sp.]MBP7104939.1 cation transporter [Fermentimonas sp.]
MDAHNHIHGNNDVKNIKTAFFLNFTFTIIELIGGVLTNSMAILSDAVHDLGDSITLGLSWYFQKISKKPRTHDFTYGYKRFSLLGALINSVILFVGCILILVKSIPRLFNPEQPDAEGMLLLAVLGIIINGIALIRLRKGSSLNERVVSLHMLEDVLGWVAVLVGAGIMLFIDAPIIDPILSIAIALFILLNVFRNLRESMHIILQGSPSKLDIENVEDMMLNIDEVSAVHDLHAWSVDGEYNVLTLHVVLKRELSMTDQHMLKTRIRDSMYKIGVQHCTIEFELSDEECTMGVYD